MHCHLHQSQNYARCVPSFVSCFSSSSSAIMASSSQQQGLSLNASRADNMYYGPDYRPHAGTLDKQRGSTGAFGQRARYLDKGVLIIRFEVPFHVRCLKCEQRIAKGVRFNAQKKRVGQYLSTPIFEFGFLCKNCQNLLVFETDPQASDYKLKQGLRKWLTEFDEKDAGTVRIADTEERRRMESDAMFKAEFVRDTSAFGDDSKHRLNRLLREKGKGSAADLDFEANALLRKNFRAKRKLQKAEDEEAKRPRNFALDLLPASAADMAGEAARRGVFEKQKAKLLQAKQRAAALTKPLFMESNNSNPEPSSKTTDALARMCVTRRNG